MTERIILAVDLADALSRALTVPEASSYVLSASDGNEYLVALHVANAELVLRGGDGDELAAELVHGDGVRGPMVRLRLTMDVGVHLRLNRPGEDYSFNPVLSSRTPVELFAPIEWAGTSADKNFVPEDADVDTTRTRDAPRLSWADYPFGELHEQLWNHLETTQRVHRVVPVRTWPDEYRVRADQVSLHTDFDQQDFIEARVASQFFPNRAAGSAVGSTPSDLLRAAVARILTEILSAPRIIADTFGPGGARAVNLIFHRTKLFVVGMPPPEGDLNDAEGRAAAALDALEAYQDNRPQWDPDRPWYSTVRLHVSTSLAEQMVRFYLGADDARREATAGVTEADIIPIGTGVVERPDAPWFEWLGRFYTVGTRDVTGPLIGAEVYYGERDTRSFDHLVDGSIGRRVDTAEDRQRVRELYIDSLDWTYWPLRLEAADEWYGQWFGVLEEPTVTFTDAAGMVAAQPVPDSPAGSWLDFAEPSTNDNAVGARPGSPFFPRQDLVPHFRFALSSDPSFIEGDFEFYGRLGLGPFLDPSIQSWSPAHLGESGLLDFLSPVVNFLAFIYDQASSAIAAAGHLLDAGEHVGVGVGEEVATFFSGEEKDFGDPGSDLNKVGSDLSGAFWSFLGFADNGTRFPEYLFGLGGRGWLGSAIEGLEASVNQELRAADRLLDLGVAGLFGEGDLSVGFGAESVKSPTIFRMTVEALDIPVGSLRGTPPPTLMRAALDLTEGIELGIAFDVAAAGVQSLSADADDRARGDGVVLRLLLTLGGDEPGTVVEVCVVNDYRGDDWVASHLTVEPDSGSFNHVEYFIVPVGATVTHEEFLIASADALDSMVDSSNLVLIEPPAPDGIRIDGAAALRGPTKWAARIDGARWINGLSSFPTFPLQTIEEQVHARLDHSDTYYQSQMALSIALAGWSEVGGLSVRELADSAVTDIAELGRDLRTTLESLVARYQDWSRGPDSAEIWVLMEGVALGLTGAQVAAGGVLERLTRALPAEAAWTVDDERIEVGMRLRVAKYLAEEADFLLNGGEVRNEQAWRVTRDINETATRDFIAAMSALHPNYMLRARPEHLVRAVASSSGAHAILRPLGLTTLSESPFDFTELDVEGPGRTLRWTQKVWTVSCRIATRGVVGPAATIEWEYRWRLNGRAFIRGGTVPTLDPTYRPLTDGETVLVSELVSGRIRLTIELDDDTISELDEDDPEAESVVLELRVVMHAEPDWTWRTFEIPVQFRVVHWAPDERFASVAAGVRPGEHAAPSNDGFQSGVPEIERPDVDDLLGRRTGSPVPRGLSGPIPVRVEDRLRAALRRLRPIGPPPLGDPPPKPV